MTLREVEIYIPNVEYRTCFYSSQESGETWWPSKCHEWTFGLKSGYQQVREVLKVHTCLPSAVGVSNISEIWVWYKVHFQFGGEARCFFRWTSVFLYFRLKNTWRVNAASIYYVDILITTNESHVSELSSGKELLWIIFPLLLKALFRRISSKEIMPDLPPTHPPPQRKNAWFWALEMSFFAIYGPFLGPNYFPTIYYDQRCPPFPLKEKSMKNWPKKYVFFFLKFNW